MQRGEDLKEEEEEEETKKHATIDPNEPQVAQEKTHKRGTSRGKSISRYRTIQYTGMRERGTDRAQAEQDLAQERGRPRTRP